jgi:hypothetical protein
MKRPFGLCSVKRCRSVRGRRTVAADGLDRVDLVVWPEPLAQHVGDDRIGIGCFPDAARGQAAEVDPGVQQVVDTREVLGGERVRELLSECPTV